MDIYLDKFFILFHAIFVLFNLLGWIWKKTRKLNLFLLLLTAFSWFFLGIWYGLGFCPFTEWHWQIRQRLGYQEMPRSYIKFLLDALTGLDFSPFLVDVLTATFFATALVCSLVVNIRDIHFRNKES